MTIKNPSIANQLIIADDPYVAAQLSSRLGRRGVYLPVINGPRLYRDDAESELIRRTNAAARINPRMIFLAGLSKEAATTLEDRLPKNKVTRYAVGDPMPPGFEKGNKKPDTLIWGRERIGAGLLKALRENRILEVREGKSPSESIVTVNGHMVIVEEGEPLSEVIAANYAYALGAGLHVIPKVDDEQVDWLLERFYNLNEPSDESLTQKLTSIKADLRHFCGEIDISKGGSITFITNKLPIGFAFPEVPTTHLFSYPDLGICILNGFTAEARKEAVGVMAIIDPETVEAQELQEVARMAPSRNVSIRKLKGPAANVRNVDALVKYLPYDVLIFATHCGDPRGSRQTYEYYDSDNRLRHLTVDVALSFHATSDDLIKLSEYHRFHSLDGVRWMDPEYWNKSFIGTAIVDWVNLRRDSDNFRPISQVGIPRVNGTGALSMFDGNYLAFRFSTGSCG